jgi:hypothetical protein
VRLNRDPSFDEERVRFALRFCCEDCGHFDGERARCRHDWPTEFHRRAAYDDARGGEIVFCKEFELW